MQTDFLAFFGFARANNIQIVTFSGRSTKVPTFVSYLRRYIYIEYGQGGNWLGTALIFIFILIFNGHRANANWTNHVTGFAPSNISAR